MITVFCLGTYNKQVTAVRAPSTVCVLTGEQGLFGYGVKYNHLPAYINEDTDVEELRAKAHRTIDKHYDAVAKGSA